jgi:peptide chain release factor 2
MQDRKRLEQAIENDERVRQAVEDLDTLFELAREGENVVPDIERDIKGTRELVDKLETAMLLSGPNDHRDAIITIHPGAGGTESQDWAEMLMRMYLRKARAPASKA